MAKSPDSLWARIVFAVAVLVFLVAVGWTVNTAVTAYESHRQRSVAPATTSTAIPSAVPQSPTGQLSPALRRARARGRPL